MTTAAPARPIRQRDNADRQDDARETLVQIVYKYVRGDTITQADDTALDRALVNLRMTDDAFSELVAGQQMHEGGKGKDALATLNEAGRSLVNARRSISQHEAETRQIAEQRAAKLQDLRNKQQEAEARLKTLQRDYDAAQVFEDEHPWLFSRTAVDLDLFTLTSGGSTINASDPAALSRPVSREVFARETARRHELIHDATKAAHTDHETRSHQYAHERDSFAGEIRDFFKKHKEPVFVAPTWADVLAAMGKRSVTE